MNVQLRQAPETEVRTPKRLVNLRSGLETLENFGANLCVLDELLKDLSQMTGDNATRAVERLCKDIAGFEPTITVLGQVKSGKTTLVNALAGWSDLLPSDVNPWTSVVTSLHLKPASKPSETGASFRFMKETDWDRLLNQGGRIGEMASRAGAESELKKIGEQIEKVRSKAQNRLGKKFDLLLGETHDYGYFDKNLLERYIVMGDDFSVEDDAQAEQGRFADIVSSADLFLNCETVPVPLCLRDTPGVNDTFMMREQVTIQAIRDSKMCVVVLSAGQALTSVDMGLIRLISNLKSRNVLIFVNRIDELSNPAQQIPEIEASIRQTLRDKQGPEDAQILFGSAYWANKVLTGSIEGMPEVSSRALFEWAEVALDPQYSQTDPNEMVWELSGVSALFRAVSERILEEQGVPFLEKTTSAALTIATSQMAAGMLNISSDGSRAQTLTTYDAIQAFEKLAAFHADAFQKELGAAIAEFHMRADRAHAKFIDRALRSLLSHLENYGNHIVWDYDPVGLRMLLRSAYTVFGANVRSASEGRFEAAMTDIAMLYADAFGSAVQGIQMAPPALPNMPAPVAFGQTIALDFNDGWWISWWNRIRGHKAFAKRFQNLIARETEDFMRQSKEIQTAQVREMAAVTLQDFFAQHRDIMKEISVDPRGGDLQKLFHSGEEGQKREKLERLITEFEELRDKSRTGLEGHYA
ncbi:dynamin family protein [Shimia sp. R9_2]|uniref:dynamin family protein n=1 Tax=Shimia sp. R9_2 TaxID=2821112 RepID=UPI001ADB7B93|nr:dynamin family protein [Shimia sp. R9_2]MBO9398195.1 dynamin family protein [Shimia sp. R9_2]